MLSLWCFRGRFAILAALLSALAWSLPAAAQQGSETVPSLKVEPGAAVESAPPPDTGATTAPSAPAPAVGAPVILGPQGTTTAPPALAAPTVGDGAGTGEAIHWGPMPQAPTATAPSTMGTAPAAGIPAGGAATPVAPTAEGSPETGSDIRWMPLPEESATPVPAAPKSAPAGTTYSGGVPGTTAPAVETGPETGSDIRWVPLPEETAEPMQAPAPTAPQTSPAAPEGTVVERAGETGVQAVPTPYQAPSTGGAEAVPGDSGTGALPGATLQYRHGPAAPGSEGLQVAPQPFQPPAAPTAPQPYPQAPAAAGSEGLPVAPQPFQVSPSVTGVRALPEAPQTPPGGAVSGAPAAPAAAGTLPRTTLPALETPEEKGLRIAQEAKDDDSGYRSTRADAIMVLRDKQNRTSERQFQASTLEGIGGQGTKSLIVFDHPKDVAGTALLTYAHLQGNDDQWLYLPALKRVKRISAPDQSGSFMSSEFSYEDMVAPELEKFTYKWLRDEPCPGHAQLVCYVFDRYPKSGSSGYSRQTLWMDQLEYRVFRIEYFDRKSSHLKTLTVNDYQQYEGRYWRAIEMLMENHQNGKSTTMSWRNFNFRAQLGENDFSRRALETLR
jgi:hypothetical protein